jgi:hypothetical protein
MKVAPPGVLFLTAALAVPPAAPASPPAAPAAARPKIRMPQARAGDFTVRLSQVQRIRTAMVAYQGTSPGQGQGSGSASAELRLQLEVTGRGPKDALRVGGLTGDLVGMDEAGKPLDVMRTYLLGAGPAGASIQVRGLSHSTTSQELALLAGELIVYPAAERLRLEVPWPRGSEAPAAAAGPVRGMLKTAVHEGTSLHLVLRVEVPDGNLGADDPVGWGEPPVRVLDNKGAPIGSRSEVASFQVGVGGRNFREYSLDLRGITGSPDRVAIDVLARTGMPRGVPFRLAHVPLPDFTDAEDEVSPDPNPYLDPQSDSALVTAVRIGEKAAGEGALLVGLSRQEAGGAWGPWRWQEVPTDAAGRAVLDSIRPGRYRIARQWHPRRTGATALPPAALPAEGITGRLEVQVPAHGPVELPPLELR